MPYSSADDGPGSETESYRQQPPAYAWEDEPPGDDRGSLALAGGIVAAVVGGLVWAAIVIFVNLEVGWVAWGVGAAVGLVMGRITVNRSKQLALTAAGLAAAGLLLGKLVIAGTSAGAMAEDLYASPEFLETMVAWQMYDAGEFEPALQSAIVATIAAGDTVSDAVRDEMKRQAATKIGGTDEQHRQTARAVADRHMKQLGIIGMISVQLRAWDFLWLGLAVSTAYGSMNRRLEEVVEVRRSFESAA